MTNRLRGHATLAVAAVIGVTGIALASTVGDGWGTRADLLAAAATTSATLVAIWLALEPSRRTGRLRLVTGSEPPWIRRRNGRDTLIRIQVVNDGRHVTRGVTARCELLMVEGADGQWEKPDLVTGITLCWYEGGEPLGTAPVDLAPGGYRYCEVLRIDYEGVGRTLPNGPRVGEGLPGRRRKFRATVVVTSDNSDPIRTMIEIAANPEAELPFAVTFQDSDRSGDPLHDPGRRTRVSIHAKR
jgi:hypothetical protein